MSLRKRSSSIEVLLNDQTPSSPPRKSALSQALQSTAHLANLLPTGTVLAFQLLTPIFTNNGSCDSATRSITSALLIILALSCLLASFTDSVKFPGDGRVHYGVVTLKGLWLFERPVAEQDLRKYRLTLIDLLHSALSVLVFVAVALRDQNVVRCLYPEAAGGGGGGGDDAVLLQQILKVAPIGIGFVSSLLFVVFPSQRHGIGYPVTRDR